MTPDELAKLLSQHHGPVSWSFENDWFCFVRLGVRVATVSPDWEGWDMKDFDVVCAQYRVPF